MLENILLKLLTIPGAIFAFSLEGFGKAFMSDKLGDPTPRNNNKLTLNPMEHIDPIGFIFIILFRFGWGKEVPTNSRFYKKYKRDNALVSIAGPLFLVAGGFILSFFSVLFIRIFGEIDNNVINAIFQILFYASGICVSLANFYLLPLPGLDGYKFITTFTPPSWNDFLYKVEKYSLFIFIGFILIIDFTNLSEYIFYPSTLLLNAFNNLWIKLLF